MCIDVSQGQRHRRKCAPAMSAGRPGEWKQSPNVEDALRCIGLVTRRRTGYQQTRDQDATPGAGHHWNVKMLTARGDTVSLSPAVCLCGCTARLRRKFIQLPERTLLNSYRRRTMSASLRSASQRWRCHGRASKLHWAARSGRPGCAHGYRPS